MKFVVHYSTVPERAVDLPAVYPLHKAYVDAFEPAADIVAIGTFEDPAVNGSMAVFATADAARRFVAGDPFVTQGLVRPSEPLAWDA
ncbi:MAG TPA: hypothetical protein VF413_04460 [Cellulomonas sp.]|jgi:uncharacterized protein